MIVFEFGRFLFQTFTDNGDFQLFLKASHGLFIHLAEQSPDV
jgi:hypothetical protein